MPEELCLVDTSWLLNRSLYAFKDFCDTHGNPIGALFGTTNFIKTVINRQLPTIFCLDSKSEFRRNLNEEYKANRESKNVWTMHDELKELSRGVGHIWFAEAEGFEADDVIFSLANKFSDAGSIVYVYSSDNDMLQTLQFPNVCVTRKLTQDSIECITESSEYYTKNYPVSPDKLAVYRAFRGDASDNLSPVVPRMQDKLIVQIVEMLDTFITKRGQDLYSKERIIKVLDSYKWTETQQNWINKLKENLDKFINNYTIMKLNPIETNIYGLMGDIKETIRFAEEKELYQYSEFLRKWKGVPIDETIRPDIPMSIL